MAAASLRVSIAEESVRSGTAWSQRGEQFHGAQAGDGVGAQFPLARHDEALPAAPPKHADELFQRTARTSGCLGFHAGGKGSLPDVRRVAAFLRYGST